MRVVLGVLFTAVVLIVMAQFAIAAYFEWRCYSGDQQACFMISSKHDLTVRNR